ncbi:NAD-dependent epimerase/dehydratase family protein [Methylobacterium radiotolerans]|uniref:NAD-dependent epimerase/dehydratase family protein n=1 Tax=Methylobacterium radiotolerans TaxID=31998 RepID=UPI0009784F92|nr:MULTISPECIES: NAD(P)-dependent oxidoreductase [Methylobacterium]MDE3749489.1 NAD(P)-dependent oxidoreductase [Methylobacterium radiotolerans]ONF48376.1 NAD-dependent dehydratase [Methylobacterium radiotolerans]PVY94271.1 nucleoside-diphosphate-sugar epimerase [Methylobacterium organophilum]
MAAERRVLLTGATGFVGAHAIPALQSRGFEVHALGRRAPAASVAFHSVDLLDAKAVQAAVGAVGAGHLLHLAWYAEPGLYWRSPLNLDWVAATLAMIRAFRERGGVRAVVAGTCAEYAWGPERLSEDAICAPATLYGTAKDATQRVLTAYARESGLSFAWGRLFFLYGPGEKPGRLVSDAIRTLSSGERFGTSPGHQRRDFSHVADVAGAFAALVDSAVEGAVNIGSGAAVPVRAILEQIGRMTGRPDLIDFGARSLPEGEPASIEADVARLRELVGFHPRYDLASGLKDTLTRSSD